MNTVLEENLGIIYDSDVPTSDVRRKETIAVLGYGIQGRAQASNLADSGFKVVVGLRKGGKSWDLAKADGHKVLEVAEATRVGDIVHMLTPDMVQSEVYEEISPSITKGKGLSFSHGAAIHWGWIKPPSDVDVFMIAPKAPGQRVREVYLQGFGTPSLVAVHQDATGRAWQRALELAKGIGSTRPGVIKTTFREETESDWFGEQVDLCGGVDRLIRTAFEVLTEKGYRPEIAYYECLHELKLIVDLIQRYGISGMYRGVSETARFGGLVVGGRVIDEGTKDRMRKVLDEIRSGEFAGNWVSTYQREGQNAFQKYLDELDKHPIEQIGRKLRHLMFPEDSKTERGKSWSRLQKQSKTVPRNAREKKRSKHFKR
ncbi:MAG TPA: ketol-acid reductoisomerase [Nitrososphaerales archaeon]|nr:ketol-acid reductoisomerase [Nitrososphaerales archaeon]